MSSPVEAPLALSLPLASAVLGSAFYLSVFNLRLDDYGWRLLGLWNLTLSLLFLWLIRSYDFLTTTRLILTFAATFLFGFFGSTAVYRLFFSPLRKFKALADYEPRVQEVIDDLVQAFEARAGTTINLTDWISFFAFDVMGRVAYNQEFGMVKGGKGTVTIEGKATSVEALRATMKMYGIFGPVPWFFKMISQIGLIGEMAIFFQWCHDTMRLKQKNFNPATDTPTDISSWIIKSQSDAAAASAAGDNNNNKQQQQTRRQTQRSIENDSILLILAGSDTAASAITNALFYLSQSPTTLATLRAHLAALPDLSLRSLATVRLLDHVINETLRLKPPAIEGLVRETPAAGITLPDDDGTTTFIPGGTVVSTLNNSLEE
ncbi:putative cytochrome p450 [Diplodia seriata]|uniref:Putative cytochrome p450 n=1 Tax=Diplodia seriata TaxID=420778 RepID=A0A0G2GX67_9PEZI|nr:putative cytochrome p450 [Diplodia seriata]